MNLGASLDGNAFLFCRMAPALFPQKHTLIACSWWPQKAIQHPSSRETMCRSQATTSCIFPDSELSFGSINTHLGCTAPRDVDLLCVTHHIFLSWLSLCCLWIMSAVILYLFPDHWGKCWRASSLVAASVDHCSKVPQATANFKPSSSSSWHLLIKTCWLLVSFISISFCQWHRNIWSLCRGNTASNMYF